MTEAQRALEREARAKAKSARGHVAHHERLIRQYWHRMRQGDRVPDVPSLRKWTRQAIADLRHWRRELEKAEAVAKGPPPPLA